MTKEQLDAIRNRFDSGLSLSYDETQDLIAEIERLQLREEELLKQKLAMMRVIAKNVSLHPPEDTQLEDSNGTK